MSKTDIGGVCLWTALVGLAVERGSTVWLLSMVVVGAVTFLLGYHQEGKR